MTHLIDPDSKTVKPESLKARTMCGVRTYKSNIVAVEPSCPLCIIEKRNAQMAKRRMENYIKQFRREE